MAGRQGSVSYIDTSLTADGVLDDIERAVVQLSLNDGPETIRAPGGRLSRLRAFFGARPSTRLASPRLEALRRYAVLYRLRGASPQAEAALCAAGYSVAQARSADRLVRRLSGIH